MVQRKPIAAVGNHQGVSSLHNAPLEDGLDKPAALGERRIFLGRLATTTLLPFAQTLHESLLKLGRRRIVMRRTGDLRQ